MQQSRKCHPAREPFGVPPARSCDRTNRNDRDKQGTGPQNVHVHEAKLTANYSDRLFYCYLGALPGIEHFPLSQFVKGCPIPTVGVSDEGTRAKKMHDV
jgi:hypothetical protein